MVGSVWGECSVGLGAVELVLGMVGVRWAWMEWGGCEVGLGGVALVLGGEGVRWNGIGGKGNGGWGVIGVWKEGRGQGGIRLSRGTDGVEMWVGGKRREGKVE